MPKAHPATPRLRALPRRAAGIAIALALHAPADAASSAHSGPRTVIVGNCDDPGPGSLRDAIFHALSGDTVDLSHLACSEIWLTQGEILVGQADLLVQANAQSPVTVDADGSSRIFLHEGAGRLTLSGLHLTKGFRRNGDGGCIHSSGSVTLRHTVLSRCAAGPADGPGGNGGGIWAIGQVELEHAVVEDSSAICRASGTTAYGAGVFAGGGLVMRKSRVTGNFADATATPCRSYCAGIVVNGGSALIEDSTIDGNKAYSSMAGYGNVAGICDFAGGKYGLSIVNSTIAGNLATGAFGGIYSNTAVTVRNSTIAANRAGHPDFAAGLHARDALVELQSSILSGNVVGGNDTLDLTANGSVVGSNNLIRSSAVAPPGSLTGDPVLAELAWNGGPTPTMAFAGWSPVIDQGNNGAGLAHDQRGRARVTGASADIGAFELQRDELFHDGFERQEPG